MIWPDGSNFTVQDIIHNLQYLKPVSGFRTKYDYDNLLYIVAGEVIHVVSGKSWCDFVEGIMKPLEMDNSVASFVRLGHQYNRSPCTY
jgi:CubicO group peptidase (beta-lactamase class C family)